MSMLMCRDAQMAVRSWSLKQRWSPLDVASAITSSMPRLPSCRRCCVVGATSAIVSPMPIMRTAVLSALPCRPHCRAVRTAVRALPGGLPKRCRIVLMLSLDRIIVGIVIRQVGMPGELPRRRRLGLILAEKGGRSSAHARRMPVRCLLRGCSCVSVDPSTGFSGHVSPSKSGDGVAITRFVVIVVATACVDRVSPPQGRGCGCRR